MNALTIWLMISISYSNAAGAATVVGEFSNKESCQESANYLVERAGRVIRAFCIPAKDYIK